MSSNASTLQDADGDYSDWIEIYNNTELSIQLVGYTLSDDVDAPEKWIFPSVIIAPHQFLIAFASGKDVVIGEELHTMVNIENMAPYTSPFQLDIYAYDGSMLSTYSMQSSLTSINIGELANGFYVLKIYNEKQAFNYKLIVSR